MKYPNITLGRVEAVWNILGGEEGVERLLRDELVVKAIEYVKSVFTVLVDCAQSLADMVKAGKYDGVSSDIVEKNFPIQSKGKAEREFHLIHFNKVMNSSEVVITELDKLNLKPGRIEDLRCQQARPRRYRVAVAGG